MYHITATKHNLQLQFGKKTLCCYISCKIACT